MDKKLLGHIKTSIENGVATVEFYHPSHNSLPGKLLRELADALIAADNNDEVILVKLVSGGDRTFCAGASFDELASIDNPINGKKFFMGFATVINTIRKMSKIVIGVVQGKAVGGGVGLASACDYTIASKYASVKLSELAIGIGPFVIGPAVERKIGVAAFSQLALDATNWQTAEWAKSKGLFTEVFQTTEQMYEYVDYFEEKLVQMNPEALALLKKVFWEGTDHWDELLAERAEMSGTLVLSDYSQREINKFLG